MSYCDLWEYETKDFLLTCIENGFDNDFSEKFFERFSIDGYELVIERKSAKNALLVHGNENHLFSATELAWISDKTELILFRNQDKNLFFVNLPCYRDTYYLNAAAFIKIFNISFRGRCCYIFRTYDGIAVGSMRCFDENVDNGFCVTKIFNEINMEDAIAFWYDFLFVEYELLPKTIINYSVQENFSYSRKESLFDEYVEDTVEREEPLVYTTYKEAYDELKRIGENDERTSFDLLEEALVAENKVQNLSAVEIGSNESLELKNEYSEEAYANAEQMLKEMLDISKE